MHLTIEIEQEEDGRWIAEVPMFPGALVYGDSRDEARARVTALVRRVLAEQIEHGEASGTLDELSFREAP